MTHRPGRRRMLAWLAALPAMSGAVRGAAQGAPLPADASVALPVPFPDTATLLVAGPDSGRMDQWADLLSPVLGRGLPQGTRLRREAAGAADGVTAANQFEVRGAPDGATALLAPGGAALAWLAGDPRVHFDAASWVPALAGIGAGVVVSRMPAAEFVPGRRLRMGAAAAGGADMAGLLGAELLGMELIPVLGLRPQDIREALGQGAVDAVLIAGQGVPDRVAALTRAGAAPVLSLGATDEAGAPVRDPYFPDLPSLPELLRGRAAASPLYAAWRAAAIAARLDVALVLPHLTPAAIVAAWRRASAQAATAPEVQAMAAQIAVRPLGPQAAIVAIDQMTPNATVLLELRRWLATRLNWRPT